MAVTNLADFRRNHRNNLFHPSAVNEWMEHFESTLLDETGRAAFVSLLCSGGGQIWQLAGCSIVIQTTPHCVVWAAVGRNIDFAVRYILHHCGPFIFPTHRPGMPRLIGRSASVRQVGEGIYHVF